MTTYCDAECPKCHKMNLVDLGDASDETAGDTEGFKCYSCGASVRLPEWKGDDCTLSDEEFSERGKPQQKW